MFHFQKKKNSKYFEYSTCLFRLSPPLSEKIRNWLTPLAPLSEKIRNWQTAPPPSVADIICERPLKYYQQTLEKQSKSLSLHAVKYSNTVFKPNLEQNIAEQSTCVKNFHSLL